MLHYETSELGVENTGHVVEVPTPTTPGCTEGVTWSVLADGGGVSAAAVARLHKVIARLPYYGYPNNNRPVPPLNGRVIKLRRGGKDH